MKLDPSSYQHLNKQANQSNRNAISSSSKDDQEYEENLENGKIKRKSSSFFTTNIMNQDRTISILDKHDKQKNQFSFNNNNSQSNKNLDKNDVDDENDEKSFRSSTSADSPRLFADRNKRMKDSNSLLSMFSPQSFMSGLTSASSSTNSISNNNDEPHLTSSSHSNSSLQELEGGRESRPSQLNTSQNKSKGRGISQRVPFFWSFRDVDEEILVDEGNDVDQFGVAVHPLTKSLKSSNDDQYSISQRLLDPTIYHLVFLWQVRIPSMLITSKIHRI